MDLRFTSLQDQEPGLIGSMLRQSYAELLQSDQEHWGPELPKWEQFDREVFQPRHPRSPERGTSRLGGCISPADFGRLEDILGRVIHPRRWLNMRCPSMDLH